ncbi:hypothetical protein P7C70_g3848, partial [Phenoliferia sp. Uapishka_3]
MIAMRDSGGTPSFGGFGGATGPLFLGNSAHNTTTPAKFLTSGLGLTNCSQPSTTVISSSNTSNTSTASSSSSSNRSHKSPVAGPVAGGVVGGFVALLAALLLGFLLYRRKASKAARVKTSDSEIPLESSGPKPASFMTDGDVTPHVASYNTATWNNTPSPPPVSPTHHQLPPELYEDSTSRTPPHWRSSYSSTNGEGSDRVGSPLLGRLPSPGAPTPAPTWQA